MGGYDASRFNPGTTTSFTMPGEQNDTLLVEIASITFGTDPPTVGPSRTNNGAYAVRIDSSIAQMLLPIEICAIFEAVFYLSWNESLQLYLVNDTIHERLQRENTNVTFSLRTFGGVERTIHFPTQLSTSTSPIPRSMSLRITFP